MKTLNESTVPDAALDWWHANQFEFYARKSKKCAEVLVPHAVEPKYLTGAHVVDETAAAQLLSLGFGLPVVINPKMFFQ